MGPRFLLTILILLLMFSKGILRLNFLAASKTTKRLCVYAFDMVLQFRHILKTSSPACRFGVFLWLALMEWAL